MLVLSLYFKEIIFIFYNFCIEGSKISLQLLSFFWNSSTTIPIVTRYLQIVPQYLKYKHPGPNKISIDQLPSSQLISYFLPLSFKILTLEFLWSWKL